MSVFEQVLAIAREQSAAVARGDLDRAVGMLNARGALLQRATAKPSPTDENAIREILRRDRDLSGAIRQRMLDLRAQSLGARKGRTALAGYAPAVNRQSGLLDSSR